MHSLRQLSTGGFIDPVETGSDTLGTNDVDTTQEQHVKMNSEIQPVWCKKTKEPYDIVIVKILRINY